MDQTQVDWSRVDAALTYLSPQYSNPDDAPGVGGPFYGQALASYVNGNMGEMLRIWDAAPRRPEYPYELLMVAKARATMNDPATPEAIAALSAVMPVEALVIEAQYRLGRGEPDKAAAALESCFGLCRTYPWAMEAMVQQTLWMTRNLVAAHPEYAQRLAEALRAPFCLAALDEDRKRLGVDVASLVSPAYASSFVEAYEPHVPWEDGFLSYRVRCYEATGNPLLAQAQQDYGQYLAETPTAFGAYLAKLALWSR